MLITPVDCPGAFRLDFTRLPARASSRDTLAFPDPISGRHPRFNFSRLARASLALRPADSLTHLTWAWSEGFDTARYQAASLLSYTGIPKPPVVGLAPTGGLARSARTLGSFRNSGCGAFRRPVPPCFGPDTAGARHVVILPLSGLAWGGLGPEARRGQVVGRKRGYLVENASEQADCPSETD